MVALAIAIGGLALGAVGAGIQYKGQKAQAKAIKQENKARQMAAELEARRERRKAIRQMLISQAQSQATGFDQGMFGSTIPGALASAQQTTGNSILNTNQNLAVGGRINAAQTAQANAGTLTSLGGGIQSIGASLYTGSETLGRVADYYTNRQYQ